MMKYKTTTDCENRVSNALDNIFKSTDKEIQFSEIEVELNVKNDKIVFMNDIHQLNNYVHNFFGRNDFTITTSVNKNREDLVFNNIEIELNFKQ